MPDLKPIVSVTGILLAILSAAMLLPALVDLAEENPDWLVFLLSSMLTLFFAVMMVLSTRGLLPKQFTVRQVFLLTNASWLSLAAFAALPFSFGDIDLSYTDAFFEAMSGLTTTGSTVIVGLDAMPPGILLWRAMLQWIGGVGIIVMGLAILPMLQVGGMQLFRAESSDRSEKVLPRAAQLATAITVTYVGLSVLCVIAYRLAGMTAFEAICHAMTTLSTGGYSTSDASFGHFASPAMEWLGTLFMISGAIAFSTYIQALRGRPAALWRDAQVRWFLGIVGVATAVIATYLWASAQASPLTALRLAAFNVTSVVTTTGFVSTDYGTWGSFAAVIFFVLTFAGGCTGSTAGGVKSFRYAILFGTMRKQMFHLTHPHGVFPQTFNGMPVPASVSAAVMGFLFLYGLTVVVTALGLSLMGLDFVTAFSAAATAVGNVGPGLGETVGPAGTFAPLPPAAKWLLSVAMLLGRLELFTVLAVLTPGFWRA